MDKYISLFLNNLKSAEGLALNTINSYANDLNKLDTFLKPKDISEIKVQELNNYISSLKKTYSVRTINRNISSIRHFFHFLKDEKIIRENLMLLVENQKIQEKTPNFLNAEEVDLLLKNSLNDGSEYGVRFSCMLHLLYFTGMRVSELVNLKVSSIEKEFNLTNKKYILKKYIRIAGKSKKERIIPLNGIVIELLTNYIELREKLLSGYHSDWLFTTKIVFNKNNQKIKETKIKIKLLDSVITRQVFARQIKDLALISNINENKISPHALRHSIATFLLNNGMDLRVLQEFLGHSSISTVQIYTHLNNKKLQESVVRNHPLNKLKI